MATKCEPTIELRVRQFLGRLGDSPESLARSLEQRGIRGHKNNANCCVLAKALKKEFPEFPNLWTTAYAVRLPHELGQEVVVIENTAASELVMAFDAGEFPELEEPKTDGSDY